MFHKLGIFAIIYYATSLQELQNHKITAIQCPAICLKSSKIGFYFSQINMLFLYMSCCSKMSAISANDVPF